MSFDLMLKNGKVKGASTSLQINFVALSIVLIASFVTTFYMGQAVLKATSESAHEELAATKLERFLSTLKDAETGQRGYLLTGDSQYLQPFNNASASLEDDLAELAKLGGPNGIDPKELLKIDKLTRDKMAEMRATIQLYNDKKPAAAITSVASGNGKKIMDELRDAIGKAEAEQRSRVETSRVHTQELTIYRQFAFAGVTILSLVALSWAYRRIDREATTKMRALDLVERQKNLLEVTLRSIGDGVIVTDAKGNIAFLNEVACTLTGWSLEEAEGKPCHVVFDIVNEDSRLPVESPVDKVIKMGTIVGLANHTVLIRRDKTEIPIDDSGAPIRDEDGEFWGVVLVFRDFSAHKYAEQDLRMAKDEAEAASVAKDHFLASLSHELRTPLTPVVAMLSAWKSYDDLPEKIRKDVDIMRRSVDLEARLIDDLLDITRITRGKLHLNREITDLHHLLQETSEMCRSEIVDHDIRLTLNLAAGHHYVTGDYARLQQVFWNVLRNAVKFTPAGGQVRIVTRNAEEGYIEVDVVDTGVGMSPETLASIFTPFEQGTNEVARKYGGLGLGLAISQALVVAHQGEISAESEGEGKGSTLRIQLPTVEVKNTPRPPLQGATSTQPAGKHTLNILLVEDHEDSALIISRLLESSGHSTVIAGTVAAALKAAEQTHFDLLLSDVGLPDGTGIDFIRQFRDRYGSQTPAVALSGFGMEEDVRRSTEAGFSAHLIKPVNFQQLEDTIGRLIV